MLTVRKCSLYAFAGVFAFQERTGRRVVWEGGSLVGRVRWADGVETKALEKCRRSREASGKNGEGGCRSRRRPCAARWDEVASDTPSC